MTQRQGRFRVLLVTAPIDAKGAWYGGGVGGYARMAGVIRDSFASDEIELIPSFHTVRMSGRFYLLHFPFRLVVDIYRIIRRGRTADALHLTLQYRSAIPREFLTLLVARLMGLPALVDIRAGMFMDWYMRTGRIGQWMTRKIMAWAGLIAVEGAPYIPFVEKHFNREAVYFPNFVPVSELPAVIPAKGMRKTLRVLFVGYCYEGKGVKELLEGCREAAREGIPLEVTLAGKEEAEFSGWLDHISFENLPLQVNRLGVQPHDRTLALYGEHDIFCMPTRHIGEGHSNATNEAMAHGMIIVCTRHGFLDSIMDEASCYFVDKQSPAAIRSALRAIDLDREAARQKAANARSRLEQLYTTATRIPQLEAMYLRLLD